MPVTDQLKNQHLLWRAGFGPAVYQLDDLAKTSPQKLYKDLQRASSKKPEYLQAADNYLQGLMLGMQEAGRQQKEMSSEQKKEIRKRSRESIRNLNLYWMNEMVNSDAQLREKMAFFWHGHFACRNLNIFFQQELLHIIRRNALGNFRDLLHEVSKTGAMLNFLNNNQNRKDHPNENFAREVMELFTMGRGNYTEDDVKEAARAFTGWGANAKGEFVFRKFQHDDGSKTVLGKTGDFDGDEVLEILLEQKQTAKFISQKIYRFFVNDMIDQPKVDWLADRFYKSGYDIGRLMEDIFTSDWFCEGKNIGCKIKSPIELLVGIQRMLPMKLENEEALLLLQRLLGQILFYPPNVAGWPGGKTWIDSSTLMMRMRIPQLINERDEFNMNPKSDDDQMMGLNDDDTKPKSDRYRIGKGARPIIVKIDWGNYVGYYNSVPRGDLVNDIAGNLLQTKKAVSAGVIIEYSDSGDKESFIKTATIQIMSTPEYQLC
ncbi:MAG TPA: DUF1800 domain-containing protein [Chitinophagaceae bacterium]|nr:DUF1800 domain-containing protein [Chitinophagaceae bacterium]